MKITDFPKFRIGGKTYYRVPELYARDADGHFVSEKVLNQACPACHCCAFDTGTSELSSGERIDREDACAEAQERIGCFPEDSTPHTDYAIFIRREDWDHYITQRALTRMGHDFEPKE